MTKIEPRLFDGRRHGVDMNLARIEDALATIRKDMPLLEAEWAHLAEFSPIDG